MLALRRPNTLASCRESRRALAPSCDRLYFSKMFNDYERHVRCAEYCNMMQALELAIPAGQSEFDLPHADDVRINDIGPVMRAAGDEMNSWRCPSAFRRDGRAAVRFSIFARW
jgi:hypothetical protein